MQPTDPSTPPATQSAPQAGDCAFLKAVTVTRSGAFMDRRPEPDLLVPISQQIKPMTEGQSYVVYLYEGPNGRLVGSTKLHDFLDEHAAGMAAGEEVDLLIVGETSLGFKAVINGNHLGLLYKDEVFRPLKAGDRTRGYVKAIRNDGKIDLSLQPRVERAREELAERILAHLRANDGVSTLTDYSPPEHIYNHYGVSKGSYKKAIGKLFKQRLIKLEKDKITLL